MVGECKVFGFDECLWYEWVVLFKVPELGVVFWWVWVIDWGVGVMVMIWVFIWVWWGVVRVSCQHVGR